MKYSRINSLEETIDDQKSDYYRDMIVSDIFNQAENIVRKNVKNPAQKYRGENKIDDILTSKWLGFPIMFLLLGVIFWITIIGANYPSGLLADIFLKLESYLIGMFTYFNSPAWLQGILVAGIYRTLAWVISVMLPPMAIFFPLFTLLEDIGYLPRVAFNLDYYFKKAGAHGKQALTMSMGFGCNAAGVIAARIIESPRERLIAILTNNFVPCNGRFPALIILASLFIGSVSTGFLGSIISTGLVVLIILLGIFVTLAVSWILSRTLLAGIPSSFILELPPYRKPQPGKILIRSFIDRTLFVLSRALIVAAPAGAIIWIFANIELYGESLISLTAGFLDPIAVIIGLDGIILLAFILGLPANEIVLPIIVMGYLSTGYMVEPGSTRVLHSILLENSWTWLTALSTMLFFLLHFPCGTTLLTIKKETGSTGWTIFAALMPLFIAFVVNFLLQLMFNLFF